MLPEPPEPPNRHAAATLVSAVEDALGFLLATRKLAHGNALRVGRTAALRLEDERQFLLGMRLRLARKRCFEQHREHITLNMSSVRPVKVSMRGWRQPKPHVQSPGMMRVRSCVR